MDGGPERALSVVETKMDEKLLERKRREVAMDIFDVRGASLDVLPRQVLTSRVVQKLMFSLTDPQTDISAMLYGLSIFVLMLQARTAY